MIHENKWQLQDAKAHFSHLVTLAEKGESVKITRRGCEVAVLISKKRYDQLTQKKSGLLDCFLSAPFPDLDLDISRSKEAPREVEL
ncbi:MAG: type II toxin-antitoxin system Phd/YefM family antitoxin [Parachlamydiaceae bacterium]|nr:type II toxin-antitoxin system Phd/YefM family antitoxin [Parachlamydiaceae bacterium]